MIFHDPWIIPILLFWFVVIASVIGIVVFLLIKLGQWLSKRNERNYK